MKSLSLFFGLVLVALLARALSAAPVQDFVVIAHNDVPVDTISPAALKDIYTGRTAYWDTGQSVIIVVLNGDPNSALKEVSGMDASQFKTFWQRMVFSGRGQLPKKADDAPALVEIVASTKGAIAVVPADAVLKDVKVLQLK